MTIVYMQCHWCVAPIERGLGEVNRQLRAGRDFFFCSTSCSAQYGNHRKRNQLVEKVCPHCELKFESHTGAKAATFCSRSCASAGSVTDARRAAGSRLKAEYGHATLEGVAKVLLRREGWRYEQVGVLLEIMEEPHEFEYPLEGVGVFDLALTGRMVLVEFDGRYHGRAKQRSIDAEKDRLATAAGWTVRRIATNVGGIIPVSAMAGVLGKEHTLVV